MKVIESNYVHRHTNSHSLTVAEAHQLFHGGVGSFHGASVVAEVFTRLFCESGQPFDDILMLVRDIVL